MLMFLGIDCKDVLNPLKEKCLEYNKDLNINLDFFNLPSHISLKISFEIDNNYEEIKEEIKKYFLSIKPFYIKLKTIEKRENIIWIKCAPSLKLLKLHKDLDKLLENKFNIIKTDLDKHFIFHSTIFVDKDNAKLDKMYALIKKIKIDKKLLVDTFLIGSSTQGILSTYKIDEVVKKETITN